MSCGFSQETISSRGLRVPPDGRFCRNVTTSVARVRSPMVELWTWNPYSPGVAPRCHLPKYAVVTGRGEDAPERRQRAIERPRHARPAGRPWLAPRHRVFPITPVRWG